MPRPQEVIPFRHSRLVADLAGFGKWASFKAGMSSRGLSLHYRKYQRAKLGEATLATLSIIATVIEKPIERYLSREPAKGPRGHDIEGNWIAVYIESPRRGHPVCTWEKLSVKQKNARITGEYRFIRTEEPSSPTRQAIYLMKGLINSDIVSGFYWAEGRLSADGIGTFQLKLEPGGYVAEGYCSFYGNDGLIAASHNFWVRDDNSDESRYQLRAVKEKIKLRQTYFEVT